MHTLPPALQTALVALLAIVAAQHLSAAGLLALDSRYRVRGAWLLPGFHLLIAAIVAGEIANAFHVYSTVPVAGAVSAALTLLLAPMTYMAVRRLSFAWTPLLRRDALHGLPAAVALALLLPYLAITGDAGDEGPTGYAIRRGLMAVFLLQSTGYLYATVRVVVRDAGRLRDVFSFDSRPDRQRVATMVVLVAVPYAALLIEFAARAVFGTEPGLKLGAGVFRLLCFWGLAPLPFAVRGLLPDDGPVAGEPGPKYGHSGLDPAAARRIGAKLATAMARDAVFRNPTLTLPELSARLGVSAHKLSQVLNEHLGTSFYDYVNGQRVAYARERLMAEPTAAILSIALDAGFNSKSSFNAAFKKSTGVTPSAWRDGQHTTGGSLGAEPKLENSSRPLLN